MSDDEKSAVLGVLARLYACGDGVRLHDTALRERVLRAHKDSGMPEDADVFLVMRPPANSLTIALLSEAVRERFGAPLPTGLESLLTAHDGLWCGDTINELSDDELRAEDHCELGVLPVAQIAARLREEHARITHSNGTTETLHLPVLPFLAVDDLGFHALDFTKRTSDGNIPVVTYYFDEASGKDTSHCKVIAPSFSAWLKGWVESGFSDFWHESE